jgi:hypothetical protein
VAVNATAVIRIVEKLESQFDNIQRIEQMIAKVKQAQQNNWPIPFRISQSVLQQRQRWYKNLWNVYHLIRELLTNADTDTRAFLGEILKESAIPELRGLVEVAGILPAVKKENAREKCHYCNVAHLGYHRKKVKKLPVIIEGVGIVYEERVPPCERTVSLKPLADEYMKSFVRKARSIEEIKVKAREANRKIGQGKPKPYYIGYIWVRELQCYARVLKEGYPNCPFQQEKPYPEIPQNPEPFLPEPAPDHFPADIIFEKGEIIWSPKHGSDT